MFSKRPKIEGFASGELLLSCKEHGLQVWLTIDADQLLSLLLGQPATYHLSIANGNSRAFAAVLEFENGIRVSDYRAGDWERRLLRSAGMTKRSIAA
jgi:hypothetical protein